MDSKAKKWLIAIFILTLTIRLILAFSNHNFTYDSYFHLRQVEHIKNTGLPVFDDDLSYGGRFFRFLPLFHYLMAFFSLFLPLELVAKIFPNILIALLTVIVYFLSKKISSHPHAPFFSAFIAGFLPILFSTNSFTPETLFLPLLLIAIYAFLNLNQKKYQYVYIISFLLLSLTSSSTVLLIMGFGIYLILSFLEGKKIDRSELELMLFSLIFFVWIQFIFFKKVLITEGISFIWQNIPKSIVLQYFPNFSIIEAIIIVGIIPFLAGIFVVYKSLFKLKNEKYFLFISFVISTTILAWFRLIEFKLSLSFFGLVLAILFSIFFDQTMKFFNRTKISHYSKNISVSLLIILFLTMIFPAISTSLQQDIPTIEDIEAFKWLAQNTEENSKIAALLEEGHLITYYGHRKNLMDDNFNLISNVEEKFTDLDNIFTTPFQTLAVGLFDKYNVNYILFSNRAKNKYSNNNFNYITINCYERGYDGDVKIYKIKCGLDQETQEGQEK